MIRTVLCLLMVLFSACGEDNTVLRVSHLQTEYLDTPMGIDTEHPRFRWKLSGDEPVFQKEVQLYVGTDSAAVARGEGEMWKTKFSGSDNLAIYRGRELQPFTRYYWGVMVTGDKDEKSNIRVSGFETGMMGEENWEGEWITDTDDITLKPAPYFRKVVDNPEGKKVVKARAYIAAAGLYELYMNGKKIGDHRLDPVYTRFDKRNVYVTYDVTDAFRDGQTAVGVLLGNGWYNHQSTAVWNFHEAGWRNRPRYCLNIRLTYDDGTVKTIATDDSWKTALSPVVFNSIYTAEHYNALKEQPGWNTPGFDDSGWKPVKLTEAPSDRIVSQVIPPIRNVEEITPVAMEKKSDKRYIFDLGRNISGVTRLRAAGPKGTRIWVTHAEQLDDRGGPDLSNIDVHYRPRDTLDPFQTDIYTLKGEGEETFMPHFNYKGFQYVEVKSDQPIRLQKSGLKGYFMHTDVRPSGSITSSDTLLNRIWEATNASYLSNLFGYPTDCPQREKNGWTGDAHINIHTGLYNFDAITVYEKWMADHRDEQQPNGVLPSIIPTGGWGYDWGNGPDWTSTIAIIPWELYLFYGDDRALRKMYDPIKKYVDHITSVSDDDGLTGWGLGDWVPVKSRSPKELTSSVYYYVDTVILSRAAALFGREDDHRKYSQLAENIKEAINHRYLNTETGIYGQGYQTELSAPLYWGIVPEALRPKVAGNLAGAVREADNHIDVGLLGTRTILGALSQNGYADLAYEVATKDTYPSWGWWIRNGATTLYENWDINAAADISRNHIMFGAIGGWLYTGIGGIFPDETRPGFRHVKLKPNFVGGLETFGATYRGPYGDIVSSWKRQNDRVVYTVNIPSNSTATVYLEGNRVKYRGSDLSPETGKQYKIALVPGTHELELW
ncbi:alpha-L-rhamnosidase [Sinomicrobium soli]|uniref:alpha-L-rhamnosidase n=1 Tax=Sinomicrobium sp. N-1-3-6 TaxID=2219864 RepID=UPI000DCEFFA7|nr:alpha-L-rhamnosidase [Sinomicrobium sp. N-1-3-6]RAV29089.1 alpha-rhamnosidase [Sinomicrobium sp. N-1-3-6]